MNRRIKLLEIFFICWFILLLSRLVFWQIFQGNNPQSATFSRYSRTVTLPAWRGEIRSADNYSLVQNTEKFLLFIEPEKLRLSNESSQLLFSLLPATPSARQIISQSLASHLLWVPVAHGISEETKKAIEALTISGLGFETEPTRLYPEGTASAYLTGFVGKNQTGGPQGYFGLEGYYNRELTGKPGRLLQELDAFNIPILIGSHDRIPSQSGQNLITSIDRTVQYLAFQGLAKGLAKYQAKSGSVSIMDVSTGQILAMVALPGYDPAAYTQYPASLYRNPVVSDAYEPGSTFKTIVMSSALDAGVVEPSTICTSCTGPQFISGHTVKNYNDKYYPNSTMVEVILHSDNVGMIFVSRQLGRERMLSYIRKFGFGQLTGVDLQEESTPIIRPDEEWRDIDWATVAFGQGIAVTPLQMLTAVNTIANKGKLVPPRLVTAIESNGKLRKILPPASTTVISAKAASVMTQMMINGVEKGEVRYYRVPGFRVAGKTGTAQVPIAGHYDEEKVIASFIGFAPADDPKFTMLVTLREPQTSPWGSTTAAPLWFNIAEGLFRYFHLPPEGHGL